MIASKGCKICFLKYIIYLSARVSVCVVRAVLRSSRTLQNIAEFVIMDVQCSHSRMCNSNTSARLYYSRKFLLAGKLLYRTIYSK